ncbi:hypothetical protein [Mycolicibacterium thermoresistibile]
MTTHRLAHRLTAAVGGAATLAMLSLTVACGSGEEAPDTTDTETTTTETTTATTATTAPPVDPTEKAPRIDPREPNAFTPEHKAPPPATGTPGRHR